MSSSTPEVAASQLVVQHNALVNARFNFTALEMRLFLAMLSQIGRADTSLPVSRISVRELCPDTASKSIYQDVREMIRDITSRSLLLEMIGPGGERISKPKVVGLPLMGRAEYLPDLGIVEAVFNEHLRPYLLELKGNFTKAQLEQLLKIKSPVSHRIYWLLREYAAFGKRVIAVQDLRNVLGFTTEYAGRFDHFRVRVLDRAQQELAQTDLPFTYELLKQGHTVTEIRFLFAPAPGQLPAAAPAADTWEAALLAVGVTKKSLVSIRTQLEAGYYDEGYIRFVLTHVAAKVKDGKVKNQAGAVYKALTDGYLLTDYQKPAAAPKSSTATPPPAALAKRREKLTNELADARNSLKFTQAHVGYTPEQRQQATSEINGRIDTLTAQLAQLR